MTYYEELGITPRASAEEIRDAYKQLARLLHPDRMQDARQRALAECQMKRLNDVYHTLSNPEHRRVYDLSLTERPTVPEVIFVPQPVARGTRRKLLFGPASMVSAGLAGGVLSFLLTGPDGVVHKPAIASESGSPPVQIQTPRQARTPAPVAAPAAGITGPMAQTAGTQAGGAQAGAGLDALITNLRTRLNQAEHDRDQALAKLQVQERLNHPDAGGPGAAAAAELAVVEPVRPLPEAPASVAGGATASPAGASTSKKSLTGQWYYVKPQGGLVRQNLYPPEFIESAIVEENGLIRGRYRARYKVVDRAIQPEVVFQFAGQAGPNAIVSNWVGPGGAKGEVRIRKLTADTIEFAWVATELGRYLGLGHGTAVLVRRQEP